MKCPFCAHLEDKVVDSRESKDGDSIRRRRECIECGRRFTSYERIDEIPYMVVKKDGKREGFDRNKIMAGLLRACEKRPISAPQLESIVDSVEKYVQESLDRERPTSEIILSILKQLATALKILKDWREIAAIVFWTVLLWISIAVPTWVVLLAFNLPLSFSDSLFIMGWAAIGSIVPTPGGAAGAFHVATANGLIFLNVDAEQAAAASIAMHLVYFAPAVFFGLYYFLHGDMSLARFKSLLSSDNAAQDSQQLSVNN